MSIKVTIFLKGGAENPIHTTLSKTTKAIFSETNSYLLATMALNDCYEAMIVSRPMLVSLKLRKWLK